MAKRVVETAASRQRVPTAAWLPVLTVADIEVSSEDAAHPIEGALDALHRTEWRAATPGEQTIRLVFAKPVPLRRIALRFVETEVERTQQYVLRWSADHGQSFREILRQEWNFSPRGSTEEVEDHHVELTGVTVLELVIRPDKSGKDCVASLANLGLA